ncbi:hypothetical protein [Stenotrophomonas sp.]|uniref:LpxL/LpxP family acyltransferase n=1 Tax=Stenotrophomonas sp. TaxID=69392 RepID=UPI00289B30ED|nr:hypothetical protein [Stenotrophomonas sp.]
MPIIRFRTTITTTLARIGLKSAAWIRQPSQKIEKWLELQLSDEDHHAIHTACVEANSHLGDYYRLYAEKKFIASTLRRCNRESLLSLARSMDRTDYPALTASLEREQGAVIALPHYGHYIITAINLMEHARDRRDVFMLYGNPKKHPGNELFDTLSDILFESPQCRARKLHADARGLATALRALKTGGMVITMPDVCPDEHHAYMIPFLGRRLEIPLGTASLARRSGAALIPAISHCDGPLNIRTLFGQQIDTRDLRSKECTAFSQVDDYRATVEMFVFFESVMRDSPLRWQYVIGHYASSSTFPETRPSDVEATWRTIQESNHLLCARSTAIPLDSQEVRQ